MIVHLPDGKNVSVNAHSNKVWLSAYNGCGAVVPLTAEQAQEIGLAMYRMGRKMKRGLSRQERTDPDLDRLLKAADAGGQGIDLGEMDDDEVIRRLSVRPRSS